MNEPNRKVPKRIASAILNSLKGGVVPRVGLPYITVGRKNEIQALLQDVEVIEEGGASFRFIVGKYGSGKSFLLQTIRNHVMDKNFVVMDADLSPDRRLQGTKGQGLATYRELIANLSTKTKPEGGALSLILDRWISSLQSETAASSSLSLDDPQLQKQVDQKIFEVTKDISGLVHGYEFGLLLSKYYHSYIDGDEETKMKVLRWFKGEYNLKSEAKAELGVNVIINDDDYYDYLKVFAHFFHQAGYSGTMIFIDELVNLYRITQPQSRQNNYEKLLAMYNDAMQGKAQFLGFVMGLTPQALEDKRRGIYSYEALRSRLEEGKFSKAGLHDMHAPVIRLEPLTPEEMLVLSEKLADMHADFYNYQRKITTEEIGSFIQIEYSRVGAENNITPREIIRDFIELLDILEQNPEKSVQDTLSSPEFSYSKSEAVKEDKDAVEEKFASFTLS